MISAEVLNCRFYTEPEGREFFTPGPLRFIRHFCTLKAGFSEKEILKRYFSDILSFFFINCYEISAKGVFL